MRLESRAIILINVLRKWSVLPSGKEIHEMGEKHFQIFYHQIADLFGYGEINDLIHK